MTKCICCGINEATRYDYRTIDNVTGKYRSCVDCFNLINKDWLKVKSERK